MEFQSLLTPVQIEHDREWTVVDNCYANNNPQSKDCDYVSVRMCIDKNEAEVNTMRLLAAAALEKNTVVYDSYAQGEVTTRLLALLNMTLKRQFPTGYMAGIMISPEDVSKEVRDYCVKHNYVVHECDMKAMKNYAVGYLQLSFPADTNKLIMAYNNRLKELGVIPFANDKCGMVILDSSCLVVGAF